MADSDGDFSQSPSRLSRSNSFAPSALGVPPNSFAPSALGVPPTNSQQQDLDQASQRSFHFAQRMPDEEENRDGGAYAAVSGYGGDSQGTAQDGEAGAGANGEDGYAGANGEDGYGEANGEDGYGEANGEEDEYDEADGEDGYAGANGEDGYGEADGEDGYAGANGEDGYAGANGEDGYAGANGEDGYAGANGSAGANGEESDDEEFNNMPVPRRVEPDVAGSALDEEDGVSPEPRTPYYFPFAQSSQPRSNEYPYPSQRIEFTPSDGVVGSLGPSSAASMNPPSAASGRLARGDAAAAAADGAALSPRSRLRRSFAQRLVESERAEREEQEGGEGEGAEEEERGARPSRRSRIPPGESKDEGESDEEEKDDYNSEAKRARR